MSAESDPRASATDQPVLLPPWWESEAVQREFMEDERFARSICGADAGADEILFAMLPCRKVKEAFSFFDTDNDDIITLEELGDVMRGCNFVCPLDFDWVMAEIVRNIDPDETGKIELKPFLGWMSDVAACSQCSQSAAERRRARLSDTERG